MINRYILGGVGVLCVTIAALWWRLDNVADDRDQWREDARGKAAVIDVLQNEAARSEAILAALRDTQDAIREDSARTRRALANVEANNAEVRSLLDTGLPDDLAGVLWPGEDADDTADTPG